mmetsp:Transcript_3636/g.5424  ORF Transcript_3636/g.5424 Transcript_3636/m.5424 type:complete len:129 (+) Transcript_3636:146-532(+)
MAVAGNDSKSKSPITARGGITRNETDQVGTGNCNFLDASLARKLILRHHPDQRISSDGLITATELLRLFVREAINRASVEAECEAAAEEPSEDDDFSIKSSENASSDSVTITGDHIIKVAADLLMDFS